MCVRACVRACVAKQAGVSLLPRQVYLIECVRVRHNFTKGYDKEDGDIDKTNNDN